MKYIDLHVHSNVSDGTFTPSELVKEAQRCNLSAFALTDHDTTAGVAEAMAAAKNTGMDMQSTPVFNYNLIKLTSAEPLRQAAPLRIHHLCQQRYSRISP